MRVDMRFEVVLSPEDVGKIVSAYLRGLGMQVTGGEFLREKIGNTGYQVAGYKARVSQPPPQRLADAAAEGMPQVLREEEQPALLAEVVSER